MNGGCYTVSTTAFSSWSVEAVIRKYRWNWWRKPFTLPCTVSIHGNAFELRKTALDPLYQSTAISDCDRRYYFDDILILERRVAVKDKILEWILSKYRNLGYMYYLSYVMNKFYRQLGYPLNNSPQDRLDVKTVHRHMWRPRSALELVVSTEVWRSTDSCPAF